MAQAKTYSNYKYGLAVLDTLYFLILLFTFAGTGLARRLELTLSQFSQSPVFLMPLYLLVVSLLYFIADFPINFFRSYALERKFCLSTQNFRGWLLDQVKGGIVSYIIGLILLSAFYYILGHFSNWWLVISVFWIFFSLVLAKLAPLIILPLFFKYKKLSDDALKERIINLARKMHVKILDVFEINFSAKTIKANAAFIGWGKTRRVILADTLKDKYTYDEIEVILAHEFAHYKLKHLLKLMLISSAFIIAAFYLIFTTNGFALKVFAAPSLSSLAALPVILIYFVLFGIITRPFEAYISRKIERNADVLALQITGMKESFVSMMEKLASQNLSDRNPHPIIKFFFFDHPPVDERIKLAFK